MPLPTGKWEAATIAWQQIYLGEAKRISVRRAGGTPTFKPGRYPKGQGWMPLSPILASACTTGRGFPTDAHLGPFRV